MDNKYVKSLNKETICLAEEVRLRQEFWGGLVFHRDNGTMVDVDKDAFALLSFLGKKHAVKVEDLLAASPGKGKGQRAGRACHHQINRRS